MDYLSPQKKQKIENWRRKRDGYFLVLILWVIVYPQDWLITLPVIFISVAFIKVLEKKLGLDAK